MCHAIFSRPCKLHISIITCVMDGLIPQQANLTVVQAWTWLGLQIVDTNPQVVRVLCLQFCAVGAFFKILSAGGVPWSVHNQDDSSLPPSLIRDLILILSDDSIDREGLVNVAAKALSTFPARYLFVQQSYVKDKIVQDVASIAWANLLYRTSIVRLADRAIFETFSKCRLPQIVQVWSLTWSDLSTVKLTNCTLRVAIVDAPPFLYFDKHDKGTIRGHWVPFLKAAAARLGFQSLLVPVLAFNVSQTVTDGHTDWTFFQIYMQPGMPIALTGTFFSRVTWCVPDRCIRSASSLLWQGFTLSLWAFLLGSVFAVAVTVWVMAPPPKLSLSDSLIKAIATMCSNAMKLPRGHARLPTGAWLLAMVVVSTCYQTILHSLMTAPVLSHEINGLDDLVSSNLRLFCFSHNCITLREEASLSEVSAKLSDRSEQIISQKKDLMHVLQEEDRVAILSSSYFCQSYFTKSMKTMHGYTMTYLLFQLYGVHPLSWMSPSLRRLSSDLSSSGLGQLWLQEKLPKTRCSSGLLDDTGPEPIRLEVFWPALLLLMAGMLVALVPLIGEVFWSGASKVLCLNGTKRRVDLKVADFVRKNTDLKVIQLRQNIKKTFGSKQTGMKIFTT